MKALASLSYSYMVRSRGHLLFASIGLTAGIATLAFFLALSGGVREKVLNRLYPVNQVEFQVERVRLFGFGVEVPASLDRPVISAISRLDGVSAVYPKQRSFFQARLWGGREMFGSTLRVEAFFDGIEPALIRDELRASETSVLGAESSVVACSGDDGCGPDSSCVEGRCRRTTWWNRFVSTDSVFRCRDDRGCAEGEACVDGVCSIPCDTACVGGDCCPDGLACRAGVCRRSCAPDGPGCLPGELCADDRMCSRLACVLPSASAQEMDDSSLFHGTVTGLQDGAVSSPLPAACPRDSYCAARSLLSASGYCEAPIPVLLSPFILDVYNDVAATALGMKRLSGLEVALGVQFSLMFGESYFAQDAPAGSKIVRRCRVAGFTSKAMDFGVTMPLTDVVRANAAMQGAERAEQYSSVVVETRNNEDVPELVEDMKELGLVLAPRSESGRRAANVLLVLTLIFVGVSGVILVVSAINIAHTFGMLVSERRREIAIYRAVGATVGDIRAIVLGEAFVLGLAGGIAGNICGWLLSRLVNTLAFPLFSRIPGSPHDLFSFGPSVFAAGLACAVVFAVAGACGPSVRASHTDPSIVLSQE